jgi:hypothetical protein
VEALKDTINQMIANLKETTVAQPRTGLVKIKSCKIHPDAAGPEGFENSNPKNTFRIGAGGYLLTMGAFYILNQNEETQEIKLYLFSAYGYKSQKNIPTEFLVGEGFGWTGGFRKRKDHPFECTRAIISRSAQALVKQNLPT